MGSPARVVVDGGQAELAAQVRDLIWRLERLWSRFIETSEISALNRAPGCVTVVSEATFSLISCAVQAQEKTGGLFNPLMLTQLESHGYSRPWGEGDITPTAEPILPATDEPIVLYPEAHAVRLPEGNRFDPGGIGKGLAVDLAVGLCLDGGANSGSVEIGGDLRVFGEPWYGPRWRIGVANPFDPNHDIASLTPTSGAVTTSTTRKRSWESAGRRMHHLLDPMTGHPGETDVVAVTTCSEVAWWSEVAAKSAVLVGARRAVTLLRELGTPGVIVTSDARVITSDHNRQQLAEARA
jgi:thiamine biosynthesis lipoprotein